MKHIFFTIALAASSTWNCQATTVSKELQPNKLWYNKPAYAFEESLPLGNGKLGALVYGGANNDSIQLNDITLVDRKACQSRGRRRMPTNGYRKIQRGSVQRRLQGSRLSTTAMYKDTIQNTISHWASSISKTANTGRVYVIITAN